CSPDTPEPPETQKPANRQHACVGFAGRPFFLPGISTVPARDRHPTAIVLQTTANQALSVPRPVLPSSGVESERRRPAENSVVPPAKYSGRCLLRRLATRN